MSEKNKADVDWRKELDGVDTPADAPIRSYPPLQFISGQPGMAGHWRQFGNFFIGNDADVNCSDKLWKMETRVLKNGNTVDGRIAREINCTVIRSRRAWFVSDDERNTIRFPWNEFNAAKSMGGQKGPRGKLQIIMAVDGLDSLVALTLKGNLSKHAVERGGWGDRARSYLYDPAARVLHDGRKGAPTRLPALCFKIRLGTFVKDGKADYLTVGKGDNTSTITPIILLDPLNTVPDNRISSYVIPRVLRESYEVAYREAEDWYQAWQASAAVDAPDEFDTDTPGDVDPD